MKNAIFAIAMMIGTSASAVTQADLFAYSDAEWNAYFSDNCGELMDQIDSSQAKANEDAANMIEEEMI